MSLAKHRASGGTGHAHRWLREEVAKLKDAERKERRRKRRLLAVMCGSVAELMRVR
jgi:hypothetical protein